MSLFFGGGGSRRPRSAVLPFVRASDHWMYSILILHLLFFDIFDFAPPTLSVSCRPTGSCSRPLGLSLSQSLSHYSLSLVFVVVCFVFAPSPRSVVLPLVHAPGHWVYFSLSCFLFFTRVCVCVCVCVCV